MDARHFDTLTRALSGSDSRRRVLAALATLPILGGLPGIFEAEDAEGQGRRKRRKKRHKHGSGRRRTNRRGKGKKQPPCAPESAATTCAGKCGSVANNCQQAVNCGGCGDGQVCCEAQCLEGACCTAAQCASAGAPDCVNRACVCAKNGNASCTLGMTCCATGCSDLKVDKDNCGACGTQCAANQICKNGKCTCLPNCAGKTCGEDGCGGTCGACSGTLPICAGGNCVACSAANPCTDGCCQDDGSCDATCRVFVSSSSHTGNLGGLAGGDVICQNLATAADLPGRFMAWLSDDTASVNDRFPLAGSGTVGPYVLATDLSTTIAGDWADLTTCDETFPNACLQHAIDRDEVGQLVAKDVWTGTSRYGTTADYFCKRWSDGTNVNVTGAIGRTAAVGGGWSAGTSDPCIQAYRLYCFQQG